MKAPNETLDLSKSKTKNVKDTSESKALNLFKRRMSTGSPKGKSAAPAFNAIREDKSVREPAHPKLSLFKKAGGKIYASSDHPIDEFEAAHKQDEEARRALDEAHKQRGTLSTNPFLEKVRAKAALAKKRQQDRRKYIIDPQSQKKILWDVLCGALIIYSVIVIPWRISFVQEAVIWTAGWFFEVLIDITFLIDMFMSCFTGFYDQKGHFIVDKAVIIRSYLKGWFTVDFLSTVPFDVILPLLFPELFSATSTRAIKLVRVFRLFRLLKLLRILRLSKKLSSFDIHEYFSPSFVRLIKLLCKIMFVAHLLACFWFLTNECEPITEITQEIDEYIWQNCGSYDLMSQYIAAFYWTIATMMAVGYGEISADTTEERVYAILTQVVGAVAFGFIIATVTIIIETMDPEAVAKKAKRDELRDYLNERGYSRDLQKRAKKHFNYFQAKTSAFKEANIVYELSHTLKEVILFESRNTTIPNIRMFRYGVSDQFITECVLRLKPMLMSYHMSFGKSGDIAEEVYFVTKGKVEGIEMIQVPVEGDVGEANEGEEHSKMDEGVLLQTHACICAVFSDGYEFELSNCLLEKPMNLRYRAAAVTDIMWLDHGSLVHLKHCFPRSAASLNFRSQRFDKMLQEVVASPLKSLEDGIYVRERIIKNSSMLSYKELQDSILKSAKLGRQNRKSKDGVELSPSTRRYTNPKFATPGEGGADSPSASTRAAAGNSPAPLARHRQTLSAVTHMSSGLKEILETHDAKLMRTWVWDEDAGSLVEKEETEDDLLQRLLINPNSGAKVKWDIGIGLLVLISVIVEPFRLGFNIQQTLEWEIFDWTVVFWFSMDILMNFRTCYMDDQQILHTSPMSIAQHYGRSWAPVDFMSTIPLDKIFLSALSGSASNLRGLRLIRILKLVRLVKLVKVVTQQSLAATEDMIQVDAGLTKGAKLFAALIFIGHLFGCFFSYISLDAVEVYGGVLNQTLIAGAGEYEVGSVKRDGDVRFDFDPNVPWNGVSGWWVKIGEEEDDIWGRYLAALYWAFTTMTTVGYGDITPTNDLERLYSTVIMILGATVFGYIVGSVSGLASNPHGALARESERNMLLTNYLEEQNVKPAYRRLAKEQLQFNRSFISVFDETKILSCFPIDLRKEMMLQAHAKTISKISMFGNDTSLIMSVMSYMRPAFFSAGQYIYRSSDEGVKAIMFLLDGIAEEVPDADWEAYLAENAAAPSPTLKKLYSFSGGDNFKGDGKQKTSAGSAKDLFAKPDPKTGEDVLGKQESGLHRNIIESGKCFGYQCFLDEKDGVKRNPIAYRAFSNCAVMSLKEHDIKSIIDRHPVLRDKLLEALKRAILRQTASDEVLNAQVSKLQKKNSLFAALQTGLKKNVKTGALEQALKHGTSVDQLNVEQSVASDQMKVEDFNNEVE